MPEGRSSVVLVYAPILQFTPHWQSLACYIGTKAKAFLGHGLGMQHIKIKCT